MALAKQTANISLTNGIDTKTDEKLVQGPNLLELENAVFTKFGRLNKRFGYETLSQNIQNGGDISRGEALGVFGNELNLYTGTKLNSYSPSTQSWVEKGNVVSTNVTDTPIVKNEYEQSNISADVNRNIALYAWEDSRGGVRYNVIDIASNTVHIYDVELDADAAKPKVVSFDNYLFIFYRLTADTSLRYQYIAINTPQSISSSAIITNDMNSSYNYDCVVNGDLLFITYHDDTNTTSIRTLDTSFVISAATIISDPSPNGLTIATDDSQNVWIAYHDGTDVNVTVYNFLLVNLLVPTSIETIADVEAITLCVIGDTATIWYSIPGASTQDHLTRFNTCTITGSIGTPADFLRSVFLASKVFIYNGTCYLNVLHESEFQSTYFTVNEDADVVAKMSYGTSGVRPNNFLLTNVPSISDTSFLFGRQEKTSIETEDSELFAVKGVFSSEIDFSSENKFQNAELGQLHIVGGILQSYDGVSVTEHNFHLYPENFSAIDQPTGGNMSDGNYFYKICYEWTDNLGQIHRSAPSITFNPTVDDGGSSQSVEITIPTLRITSKKGNRSPVRIVVYRTEDNGNVFYRTSSITSPLFNDPTVDSVVFVDTNDDATLVSNEPIYTTGGVLENSAPPSCSLVKTYKNRVFVSGLPDPLEFWYSKERVPGTPVEFTPFFSKRVDAFGGPITAIAVLDSNFLIFKEQAIFLVAGDGPNALGGGVDYGDPQLITTDAGCENPNTIVNTPNGIMFKSSKGIYIITRSLQVEYLGDRVENFNDLKISGAALVPDTNQVRFTTEEGTTLMYDYFFNQWGVFTNQPAEDCDVWDGKFVYLRSTGQVWKEDNTYTDDNLAIPLKITTNWISLAGLQGYQRIYRMIFLGDYKTAHRLQVAIGYDFNPNFEQFATVDVADVYPLTAYGEDSPYGTDASTFGYGGGFPLYQFKTHLTKQKCTSIRFRFQDSETNQETFGEAFNMTNLALEVGIKGTLRKYNTGNSYATS